MSQFMPALTDVTDGLAKIFAGDTSGADQIAEGVGKIVYKMLWHWGLAHNNNRGGSG